MPPLLIAAGRPSAASVDPPQPRPPMHGPPVQLDDHPLLGPEAIGSEEAAPSGNIRVAARLRQAMPVDEGDEPLLQLVENDSATRRVVAQQGPQDRRPTPPRIALEKIRKRQSIGETENFRLVHRLFQLAFAQNRREIEQRPRYGRHRNPADHNCFVIPQGQLVHHDTRGRSPSTRPRDFGRVCPPHQQPPHVARGPMAQGGAIAASQSRRPPPSLISDRAMADRVDATMDRMQGPPGESSLDRSAANAKRNELVPSDDPMLSFRQVGDRAINRSSASASDARTPFPTHIVVNGVGTGHAADGVGAAHAHGARFVPKACRRNEKEVPARRYRLWL